MSFNSKKKDGLFFKLIEAIVTIVLMNLGFYIAFLVRFNMDAPKVNTEAFFNVIPYISIAVLVVFFLNNVFSMFKKSLVEIIFTILSSVMVVNFVTIGIVFFAREFTFPRSVFIISFIIQIILLLIFKMLVLKALKYFYKKENILVVGLKKDAEKIAKKLVLDKQNLDRVKYVCNIADSELHEMVDEADKIYVGSSVDSEMKSKLVSYCIGGDKTVYIVPELFEIALVSSKIVQLDDTPIFKIENLSLSIEKLAIKRIFDILASLIGIVILSPVMLIVAISIKLYDKGPILFVQERITMGNKEFDLYKFRTMIIDAEKHTGPTLAKEKDSRITPLGKILRRTRLDEIPQLFNVLKGEMSIVGPRPERKYFIDRFAMGNPDFRYRTVVKAGVTGLAQILGKYTTTPEDKLRFDLLYIKKCSLLSDISIILKTIRVVFTKSSSEGVKKETLAEEFETSNIKVKEDAPAG